MLTPQDYSAGILKVLRIPHENLVDLYVIPNYKNFFKGCVDRHFGLFKNEDYTKLQFTLEAVPVDPVKYPVGPVGKFAVKYASMFFIAYVDLSDLET